jgi:hypothetical protein
MGKIDDMRRQREQAFADAEQREAKAAKAVKAAPVPAAQVVPAAKVDRVAADVSAVAGSGEPAQPTRPTRPTATAKKTSSKSGASLEEQGKCPDCGKSKPLVNGVMASHQKGFGKACSGSRKKPV